MKGYFDRLDIEKYRELSEFVLENGCDQSCRAIAEANIEEVLLTLEQIRTSDRRVLAGWLDGWIDKVPMLRRQIGDYTIFRLVDSIEFSSDNWAVNLLGSTGFGTTYISLNYDNIAESILSHRIGTTHCEVGNCPHCKMRQLLRATCQCSTRSDSVGDLWKGALLKPHGSIAWSRCVNPECCSRECIVARCDCNPARDERCSNCREPNALAMILPTMSKNLNELPEIAAMWQAANLAASQAESILMFGFSFPPSDALFARMIQHACNGGRVKRIGVVDLYPDIVLGRVRKLIATTRNVEFIELPVPQVGVPTWYEAKKGVFNAED